MTEAKKTVTFEMSLTLAEIMSLVFQLSEQQQAEIVSGILEQEQENNCPITDATIQLLKDWALIE